MLLESVHRSHVVVEIDRGSHAIELLPQRESSAEPFLLPLVGQAHIGDREVGGVRIAADGKRLVRQTQVGGAAVGHFANADVIGNRALRIATQIVDDRQTVGMLGREAELSNRATAEHFLLRMVVADARVGHGAQDRKLVGHRGVSRQQFADLQARHLGGNRRKRPTILGRCVGLGIVGFQMRCPAMQPDDNQSRAFTRRGEPRFGSEL